MTGPSHTKGASRVGQLTDVAPWEAELIMAVRFWMADADSQAEVWNRFAQSFGAAEGLAELRNFEGLLSDLCRFARRPFVRHGLGCTCIGSDEAILQTLVREAAYGDLAEAAMIASLIVPARHAEPVALMAARVGQAMQRMVQTAPAIAPLQNKPQDRTLH
ncbi:hypothetical protein AN191_03320 [Loktanella sp. 5RATIMAR09]|uniref:hypothetical protein n=1 Tax=Loktanella sp. 5RATIMAR09 TaxID=1225655 RepID=UPI0006EBC09D|nr:hypothetical protein [Loktanella sp. 5RATIMAR09]KQI72954.1 hypothetical protein AN191_03320 [Loktanella sp. 5RATIMAR09]